MKKVIRIISYFYNVGNSFSMFTGFRTLSYYPEIKMYNKVQVVQNQLNFGYLL